MPTHGTKPALHHRSAEPPQFSGAQWMLLLWGVFFSFAPVGILSQMITPQVGNWIAGLIGIVIGGSIAVGWSYSMNQRKWWLLGLVIVGQVVVPTFIFDRLWSTGLLSSDLPLRGRLAILSAMVIVCIAAGYVLIITFVRRQEQSSARLKTELEVARQIHESIVPDIKLSTARLEVFGRSEASSEMGGDLIDIIAAEGRTDLYLADVSGHGVGAGIVMGMVKSAIRMRLRADAALGSIVSDLNTVLEQLTRPDMFATFACLRFCGSPALRAGSGGVEGVEEAPARSAGPPNADPRPIHVEYALAGHHPILHYSLRDREVRLLPNDHLPLGIVAEEQFTSATIEAGPGDLFVMFTDGLSEVVSPEGKMMGSTPIVEIVRLNADRPLEEIHRLVMQRARQHGPQADDQTLLLARVR